MDQPLQYLQFSGKEEDFAVWQERFEGFCFTKKPLNVLNGTDAGANDKKYEIWADLVLCLDCRSILMLANYCKGDGPKATTAGRLLQHRNTEIDEPIGEVHNPAIGAHLEHG